MTRVVGLGAGGHARVVIDILRLTGDWDAISLLDPDPTLRGTDVDGAEVVGDDEVLPSLVSSGFAHAFVGVGSSPDLTIRRRLYALARHAGMDVIDAVHPSAVLAASATIGPAVTVCASAVVGPGAHIGENVIVNTGAIVEHGCSLGDHVHVASGAVLGGDVRIGMGTHVGLAARVVPSVRIGVGAVVGAGAVVLEDVPDGVLVVGTPARVVRRIGHEP